MPAHDVSVSSPKAFSEVMSLSNEGNSSKKTDFSHAMLVQCAQGRDIKVPLIRSSCFE